MQLAPERTQAISQAAAAGAMGWECNRGQEFIADTSNAPDAAGLRHTSALAAPRDRAGFDCQTLIWPSPHSKGRRLHLAAQHGARSAINSMETLSSAPETNWIALVR